MELSSKRKSARTVTTKYYVNSGSSSSISDTKSASLSIQKKNNRTKRFAPKVRTGCITCRSRRIKCDEARPSCLRCRKADYVCEYASDGLNIVLARQCHELPASLGLSTPAPTPKPILTPLPQSMTPSYGSGEESRYLATFLSLSAPWFARYHNPHFFHVTLPQNSWYHPALRHALVAVAMASEQRRCPDLVTRPHRRNWHYSQALLHMHQDRTIPEEVALLTSVMFWLHDNITNNSRAAMVHLHGFLKIIIERKSRAGYTDSSLEDTILQGLVYKASIADPSLAEIIAPEVVQEVRKRLEDPHYIHSFTTLDAVRDELKVGLSAMQFGAESIMDSRDRDTCITFADLRKYFERWHRAFSNVPNISKPDEILLECHYVNAALAIYTHEQGSYLRQLSDPQSVARFDYVLDRIESLDLASLEQAPMAADVALPIIPTLSEIIRTAASFRVRMKAFRLLRCLNRTEGFWNSDVAADLMEAGTGMAQSIHEERLSLKIVSQAIDLNEQRDKSSQNESTSSDSHLTPITPVFREVELTW